MVGSSKILTVSYGTFSCTLEGFDDPFSTMRSIAEYFRDLAADDRYFGAEPPTPDADMLHRIAQREVEHRVETRVKGDGIVLRQLDGTEAAAAGAVAGATVARASEPETDPEPVDAPAPAAEYVAAPDPVMEPVTADDTEPMPAAAEDAPEVTDEPQEEVSEPVAEVDPVEEPVAAPQQEDTDFAAVESIYAEDDDPSSDVAEEFVDQAPAVAPLTGEANSVAAKLSRIRAVVSGGANTAAGSTDDRFAGSIDAAFASDGIEDAQFEDMTDEAPDAADADVPTVDSEEDMVEPTAAEEQFDAADDIEEAAEVEASVAADVVESDAEDSPEISAEGSLAARIVKLKRAAQELSHDTHHHAEDETGAQADDAALAADGDEAASGDDDSVISGDSSDDVLAEEEIHVEEPAADDSGDEAFDAMKAAIARAKALSQFEEAEDTAEAETPADEDDVEQRHSGFDDAKTEEAAFDRILEETNTKMDEDEGSRRRSAIAHLKAAVAATKADRLLKRTRPDQDAEEQSQYRDDLAKVVQPHRPTTQPRGERDEMGNPIEASNEPAPLVLVSEQRVDAAAEDVDTDSTETVQDTAADDGAFADFAAKMGATDLPDLLEAAAAYTAFVEGNKMFSRPDLMRRVSHVESSDEYSREAGLRSFGQLLRQGKIQKLKRGQFTIAEESRFNPQARLAGE